MSRRNEGTFRGRFSFDRVLLSSTLRLRLLYLQLIFPAQRQHGAHLRETGPRAPDDFDRVVISKVSQIK